MLELWKARKARKAAVATIAPMVRRSKFQGSRITERHWLDAYMIGFVMMLISLVARRRVHSIDDDTLGIVQAEAWEEITGLPGNIGGEEACLLSVNGHRDFQRGCLNAIAFMDAMTAGGDGLDHDPRLPGIPGAGGAPGGYASERDRQLLDLWHEFFEQPMTLEPFQEAQVDPADRG
ncbi:hypothetical protein HPQ64_01645 [Rhizobiales bacterium]|uniref:hypothetical protein n=1 Tax=Hongsoonwoonella zoysiae TaxID=2821844 RepID=UPI0015604603|nr:hypothetical protein [Hongsoonwoonella zoysiae]NRG16388.1 hypothetical protein [Hongsoonwoonella zoysiae]